MINHVNEIERIDGENELMPIHIVEEKADLIKENPLKLKSKEKETNSYHVKNMDLVKEIVISKSQNKLTDAALVMLIKMVKKIGNNFTYYDPMDREDCEQAAIEDVLKYWRGFKPELSTNAFSYYTQVIKNGYAKGWKQLHKIKKKNMVYMNNNIWSVS